MLREGLAPWSLPCLRMFTGQCSGAISGCSVWQGNLVSLYLTLLFDACCEGWGFEKKLLRLCAHVFVVCCKLPLWMLPTTPGCGPGGPYRSFRGDNQALGWVGPSTTVHGTASVPPRPARVYYCARYRPVPLQYRSDPLLEVVRPRNPSGPLYYWHNARYRLGTTSVPLGPSITMRGSDTPLAVYKVLIGSE